jgi:hypothetical protein
LACSSAEYDGAGALAGAAKWSNFGRHTSNRSHAPIIGGPKKGSKASPGRPIARRNP